MLRTAGEAPSAALPELSFLTAVWGVLRCAPDPRRRSVPHRPAPLRGAGSGPTARAPRRRDGVNRRERREFPPVASPTQQPTTPKKLSTVPHSCPHLFPTAPTPTEQIPRPPQTRTHNRCNHSSEPARHITASQKKEGRPTSHTPEPLRPPHPDTRTLSESRTSIRQAACEGCLSPQKRFISRQHMMQHVDKTKVTAAPTAGQPPRLAQPRLMRSRLTSGHTGVADVHWPDARPSKVRPARPLPFWAVVTDV